jgi:hypothetical protein
MITAELQRHRFVRLAYLSARASARRLTGDVVWRGFACHEYLTVGMVPA